MKMNKKLNIQTLASLAGVSTATVSRVLNDYPFIRESTRKRVLKIINETNYRVNAVARNLRRKKTYSIGVIVSNVLSSFYSIIAKAVEDIAITNNYSTILCNGGDNPEKERKYLRVLHENRVDGIILSPTGKNVDYLKFLISSGIPVTFIDRITPGIECDAVLVNNGEATFRGIDYLIKKGYSRIGCISGPTDRLTGAERYKGYCRAHRENGLLVDQKLVRFGDFSLESGREKTQELLDNKDLDALFVANTDMAIGAYQVIKEKGIVIPEDIAFLIFDDPVWTTLVEPKVTAISQPVYTLGSTAADLLFKRIIDGVNYLDKEPIRLILEANFIIRESA